MSCIYGWWNLSDEPISTEDLKRIETVSSWWNPSDKLLYHDHSVALGQLTSNINSNTKDELISTLEQEDDLVLCCDARIDNRTYLLKLLGIRNPAISDSLLVLKTYKKFGEACVNHLIGAFAFAIWDKKNKKIFCARDHLGIKPFNYAFFENRFLFGSQRKCILESRVIDTIIDWEFVLKKLSMKIAVDDGTENLHIRKLLPAHTLTVSTQGIKIASYWELDVHKETIYSNDNDYVEHFDELYRESIKARMRGSDKVGAHLSGGLDSSGISGVAASVSSELNKELHTYAYTFSEAVLEMLGERGKIKNLEDKDEKGLLNFNPLVRDQVAFSNIKHSFEVDEPNRLPHRTFIEHETTVCDGISWSNNVNTEFEIQKVAQNNKAGIILSGFLGDELITSLCRTHYLEHLDKGNYLEFFKSKQLTRFGPKSMYRFLVPIFLYKQITRLGVKFNEEKLSNYYRFYKDKSVKTNPRFDKVVDLLSPSFIEANPALKNAMKVKYEEGVHKEIPLSFKAYQRNHLTRAWTSRRMESENLAALNFNMEYRYPMSDIRVNQYVLSIPIDQKRRGEQTRYLFKRAMKKYVPKSILDQGKFSTSLKPLEHIRNKSEIDDNSFQELWKELRAANALDFVTDKKKVDQAIQKGLLVNRFYPHAILGLLIKKNYLSI